MARRHPRQPLPVFLTLAGLYFSLHSLLLVLIPIAAGAHLATTTTGAVLMLYTGLGIAADIPAGRAASRYGVRAVVLVGAVVMVVGSGLLAVSGAPAVVAAATVLGIGSSLLLTPILGGLAAAAGRRQRGAQVVNACVQRIGAFAAALLVGATVGGGAIGLAWLGAGLVAVAIAVVALVLPTSAGAMPPELLARRRRGPRALLSMYAHALEVAVRSRQVAAGLICNVVLTAVMIFGFSFFPLVLLDRGHPELLGPALASREVVAIGAAIAAGTVLRRVPVRRCVEASLVLTVASLLGLGYVTSPVAVCALFAAQGSVLAFAILGSNIHIYEGTSATTRMYGYAAGGVVARLSGIVVPVVFGLTAAAPGVLLATAAAVLAVATIAYGWLQAQR